MSRADARPLLVSDAPDLIEDVARLAASAGVELEVCPHPELLGAGWTAAPVVLIAADLAESTRAAGLGRRSNLIVIGADPADTDIWRRAVGLGAEHVVFLPDAETWLVDRLADVAESRQRPAAAVLGVVAGRGGGGATTLSVALGLAGTRRRWRTILVDADPLGGGIDLALGAEETAGLRWGDLAGTAGRVSAQALVDALPHVRELAMLSWDRGELSRLPSLAVHSILSAAQRGSDLVVVDLPRSLDDAGRAAVERCTTVLLLVPAEVRATAAAARVAAGLSVLCPDVRLVVRGPAPGGLDAAAVAAALALPLAGWLRPEPGLATGFERGEPPGWRSRGPLARFCSRFLAGLDRPEPGGRTA